MKDKLRQLLALILALSICFSLLSANVWATDEPEDVPTESTEVVTEKDKSEEKQEETPAETPSEDKQEEAPAETQNENKQEEAPAETQSENKQEETPAEAQSEDKQEEEAPAQNEAETQPMKKKALGKMPGMGLTAYAATSHGITINTAQHGTVTASVNGSAATSAEEGATVTLTANPDNGYRLKSISGTYKGNLQETKGLNGTKTINGTYFNLNATDAAGRGWKLANNSTITITSKDTSVIIVKVDFNITQRGNSFNLNNVSCSAGTKSLNGNTLSVSSINGTTVTLSSSANNAGYVRFNSVTIYGTGAVDTNLTISTTGDVNVRTFTMPAVGQGDVTITPVFEEIPKYNVTLNGGANATTSGGNTTQTGVTGAMTTVTYTANSGYHFTEFANITNNGITATRTSDTVVTVSGTPTADASITIPDAVADAVAVTGVNLNKTETTLTVNGNETLTATVAPDNATDKTGTVSWTGNAIGLYADAGCTQALTNGGTYTAGTFYVKGLAAGSSTITVTTTDGSKTATCDVTVNKLNSTVTKAPTAKTLTYTGSAQELVTAGTAEGGTMMYAARIGDTYPSADEYSENIPTLTNANDHRYVWYYVKGDANHLDSEAQCVFVEIAKASITPSVSIENWTYGEAAKTPSVTGNTGNGTVTYTYAKQGETTFTDKVPTDAGSYTVKATVAETANYNSGTNTAGFTINQASITITADDKSTKYGENIAELTYSVSGAYKTGDDLGVTLNTEATKTSPVNVYDITVNWNQNPNYTAVLAGGKYTITKDGATISASAFSGAYDGKAHGITVEETKHNIFDLLKPEAKVYYSTEELTVENFKEKGSTENITYTNVGEYTVYYFVESGNYDVQPISGSKTVSITKAPLTVTAKDKTIAYGEAPANDSVQYDGFAKGEDESVLTGELSYAYNYKQGDNSGEYTITPSGLTSDNYEITFVDGKLTVKALGDPTLEVTTEGEDKRLDIVLDQESAEKLLTKDELKDYNNGVSATVYVLVDELSASDVPAADKKLAEEFMKDGKIGQYLDLTLWVKVGNRDARQITNAASDITLKIAIPEKLQSKDAERTFYLIRVHDGKAESLASTTGDTLEADSRLFSTYAIGYKDKTVKDGTKKTDTKKTDTTKKTTTKTSGKSPKTGDAAMLGLWVTMAGASATGLGALALTGKRRKNNRRDNRTAGRRRNR